ncbi:MAG: deoxyguanosinetriphosphate triphosphohydrolase, partial [Rickettsiales bacterium]|nr:deoxyguanosinetriphosphate triphosphohydrolase [Rickettsiales bacterium]
EKVRAKYPDVKEKRLIPEVIRELIGNMISDLIAESLRRIEKIKPKSADDIRECGQMIIGFSDEYLEQDKVLRKFLWNRMYTHNREAQKRFKMSNVVKDIFECFIENPKCMPERWYNRIEHYGLERTVIDYIAGMTDKYALKTYRALYDPQFQEI